MRIKTLSTSTQTKTKRDESDPNGGFETIHTEEHDQEAMFEEKATASRKKKKWSVKIQKGDNNS